MAHVTLVRRTPKGLLQRYAFRYTRKRFGRMADPTAAAVNHGGVLVSMGAMEMGVAKTWKKISPELWGLVVQLAATRIGCSWCVDYGYYEVTNRGVAPEKIKAVTEWRDSPLFDDAEAPALGLAEVATDTPVAVSDDLVQRLHRHFHRSSDRGAGVVGGASENFRSRFQQRARTAQPGLLRQLCGAAAPELSTW